MARIIMIRVERVLVGELLRDPIFISLILAHHITLTGGTQVRTNGANRIGFLLKMRLQSSNLAGLHLLSNSLVNIFSFQAAGCIAGGFQMFC